MNLLSIIVLAVGVVMCGLGACAIHLAVRVMLDERMLGEEIRPPQLDPDELGLTVHGDDW